MFVLSHEACLAVQYREGGGSIERERRREGEREGVVVEEGLNLLCTASSACSFVPAAIYTDKGEVNASVSASE